MCEFYYLLHETRTNQALPQSRQPVRPEIDTKAYCTHPESLHPLGTMCDPALCNGDIAKCDIPPWKKLPL